MRRQDRLAPVFSLFVLLGVTIAASPQALAASDQVFSSPAVEQLKQAVDDWIARRNPSENPIADAVAPLWEFKQTPTASQKFDALMRTYYLADDQVRALVDRCNSFEYSAEVLQLQAPTTQETAAEPLLGNNVRYFLARHLSLLTAYPEAAELFEQIDPNYVVDPAGCLFYRSVCEHHLLMRERGLESLKLLLTNTEDVPLRYQQLGELMKEDLGNVKEKSLAEVARQMKDVRGRLALGRADEGTQDVEKKIVETLDDLIKKMEQQQQQQQQQMAGASGNSAPKQAAEDTYLGGIKGEGLTDKKDIGKKDNWGDLPPKAREAARNMLDRQFPSHYRQAVEEYLKKLADRPAPQP